MTTYTNKKTGETVRLTKKEAERFFDNRDPNEWERARIALAALKANEVKK
jgi:hypothetical protein